MVFTLALLGHQTSQSQNKFFFLSCTIYYYMSGNPAECKKIEKDMNWGIGKDPEWPGYLYFSNPMSGNIYLFLSPSLSAD